jgi:hypothetical protein
MVITFRFDFPGKWKKEHFKSQPSALERRHVLEVFPKG